MVKGISILTAAAAIYLSGAMAANAYCIGSGSFSTCRDSRSGNSYTIQRSGDTTYMHGRNYNTGSTWSQNSQTIGTATFHHGRDADGNSWSSTCVGNFCY